MKTSELIYDWNQALATEFFPRKPVLLNDETLRDGPAVSFNQDLTIDEKIQILHLMGVAGNHSLDLGAWRRLNARLNMEMLAREMVATG
jgi:2-isopropylmalate synthase